MTPACGPDIGETPMPRLTPMPLLPLLPFAMALLLLIVINTAHMLPISDADAALSASLPSHLKVAPPSALGCIIPANHRYPNVENHRAKTNPACFHPRGPGPPWLLG